MIDAFKDLSKFGAGDPTIVADSISKALCYNWRQETFYCYSGVIVVYNLLNKRIKEIEEEVDKINKLIINIVRDKNG